MKKIRDNFFFGFITGAIIIVSSWYFWNGYKSGKKYISEPIKPAEKELLSKEERLDRVFVRLNPQYALRPLDIAIVARKYNLDPKKVKDILVATRKMTQGVSCKDAEGLRKLISMAYEKTTSINCAEKFSSEFGKIAKANGIQQAQLASLLIDYYATKKEDCNCECYSE